MLLILYAHILAAVFWVGHALFWTIVIGSLQPAQEPDGPKLFGYMSHAGWPPAGIPAPFRVRFQDLGWAFLVVLAATGALIVALRPAGGGQGGLHAAPLGPAMSAKLVGVAALVGLQAWWRYRPRPALAYLTMGIGLIVVALSAVAR
jgi:hypothetical protein